MRPLDAMTLVYHRPSGITHMVVDPVPQILEVMAGETMDAKAVAQKLSETFDLGTAGLDTTEQVLPVITERLEEMASLGLVEQLDNQAEAPPDA